MIVVDSSVWIDHLSGRLVLEVEHLRAALADPDAEIIVGDLVLFEVLAGLRTPRMAAEVRLLMESLEVVSMIGAEQAARAAEHFRALRALGITPRTVDLFIATFCVAIGAALLTRDRDLTRLAGPLGLRLI